MANPNDPVAKQLDDAYKRKVVGALMAYQRRVAQEIHRSLQMDSRAVGFTMGSPVWTGRFLASNVVSVGAPDTKVAAPMEDPPQWPDEPDRLVPWLQTRADVARALLQLQPFDVVYISNSLPYSRRIEAGWSAKAPEGVYGVTVEALLPKLRNIKLPDSELKPPGG